MENKQTAAEWLMENIDINFNPKTNTISMKKDIWEKAIKMEKEQIKDAWLSGQDDGATICTPNQHYPDEDYYNETYGK